jgi:hypothetical protein
MRRIGIYILLVSVLFSCKKKSEPIPAPSAALLTSPLKNESCNTGTALSATESTVVFNWAIASNTETYELSIRNLLSNEVSTKIASSNTASATLKRNTPYSWFVTSKSSRTAEINKSEVWKFYNAGLSTTSYAPFPAEIVAPKMNDIAIVSGGKATLSWTGLDVDNDIVGYDVYFGANASPVLYQGNLAANVTTLSVTVTTNTYYWKIITKDSKGNSSDSGVFKFVVN